MYLRLKSFFVSFCNTLVHIFLGSIPDIGSPGFYVGSEKKNALFARVECGFSFVQFESKCLCQKITNLYGDIFECFSVFVKKYHVIHVSSVVFDTKCMFYEMVEFMEVEIAQELTHEVSEWESPVSWC